MVSLTSHPLQQSDYVEFDRYFLPLRTDNEFIEIEEVNEDVVHVRKPFIDLAKCLQDLLRNNGQPKIIYIYTDTLIAGEEVKLPPKRPQLHIFARHLFPGNSSDRPAIIHAPEAGLINFASTTFGDVNAQVYLRIKKEKESAGELVVLQGFDEDQLGLDLLIRDDSTAECTPRRKLDSHMIPSLDITRQLLDNHERTKLGLVDPENANVVRLLNYQMLLATALEEEKIQHSLQLAMFVERMTRGFQQVVDLNIQATTFISRHYGRDCLVPTVDLSVTKQVLKSRLASMNAFEEALRTFERQIDDQSYLKFNADITLAASKDADSTFDFLRKQISGRFNEDTKALQIAQNHFAEAEERLAKAQEDIKEGIEEWGKAQRDKAYQDMFWAIVGGVGALVLSVYNPPAGAGGVVAAGEGAAAAVKTGVEVAKKASFLTDILEDVQKIWELVEKLKPIFDEVKKAVEETARCMEEINAIKSQKEGQEELLKSVERPSSLPDDTVNLQADWKLFEEKMDNVLTKLETQGIGGVAELRTNVHTLVVRAKAVLICQQRLKQSGDQWYAVVMQSEASRKQTNRLQTSISSLVPETKSLKIFKTAMLERIMALRVWVSLDFQAYVQAYMWYSLDSFPPIRIHPLKRLEYFVNDAALLQAAIAQADERIRAQQRIFSISLPEDKNISLDWQCSIEAAKFTRSITFTIGTDHPAFQNYSRLRIQRLRVFLEGIETPHSEVRIAMAYGDKVHDRTMDPKPLPRTFLFPHTWICFAYKADTPDEIVLDGILEQSSRYVKPSPFTEWTVVVLDEEVKLDNLRAVRIEMLCTVSCHY